MKSVKSFLPVVLSWNAVINVMFCRVFVETTSVVYLLWTLIGHAVSSSGH